MTLTEKELDFLAVWWNEEGSRYEEGSGPAHRLQLLHGVRAVSLGVLTAAWAKAEGKEFFDILGAVKNPEANWPWSTPKEFQSRLDEARGEIDDETPVAW
jgi:hypothetical protein